MSKQESSQAPVVDLGDPSQWSWPVPTLTTAVQPFRGVWKAEITNPFQRPSHLGVDIMYRKSGPPQTYFAPPGVPIMAARDGVVWSTGITARGMSVVIDHGKPFATFYQHLSSVRPEIVKGLRVPKGHVLGTMGADPTDPAHVRHLHFAVWMNGAGDVASIDPAHSMLSWSREEWTL